MSKPSLITFADGGLQWRLAGKRFAAGAERSGLFSTVGVANLKTTREHFQTVFSSLPRGFMNSKGLGYWLWKPLMISRALRTLPKTEPFLVYLDVGFTVNATKKSAQRLADYLEIASENNAMVFSLPNCPDESWTKPEVFEYFCTPPEHRASDQRLAGAIVLRNSAATQDLIDEWVSAATYDNSTLLTDQTRVHKSNYPIIAHRHDQSIWSLITKRFSIPAIKDETYFAPNWSIDGAGYPLWATRLRSLFSSPNPKLAERAITKALGLLP